VGDEVQLLDSSRNNPTSWVWDIPDADTSRYQVRNPQVMFLSPGLKTITLKVSNETGTDSISRIAYINVLPSPQMPVVSSSKGMVLCDGDSTVISTDVTSNFNWFRNNLLYPVSQNTFTFKEEALFFVRVQGSNGCRIKSNELKIITGVTPAKPTISKDLTANAFCEGGSFNLTSSAASGNQWYVNDTLILGQTGKVLNRNEAGAYKVLLSDKGCTIASDVMSITKLPRPISSAITGTTWAVKNDTARFSVVGGMVGSTFNWTLTGGMIQSGSGSNVVLIKFNNVASSTINMQENATNGCKGELKTIQVNLVNTSLQPRIDLQVAAYPNPVKDYLILQANMPLAGSSYRIVDVLGKEVKTGKIPENETQILLSELPTGIFVIQVQVNDKQAFFTFVKE
jgi:PKD repeat protein